MYVCDITNTDHHIVYTYVHMTYYMQSDLTYVSTYVRILTHLFRLKLQIKSGNWIYEITVQAHMYIHMYVRAYVRMYFHMYIRTYVCMYVRTYIHTYVHTYVCTVHLTTNCFCFISDC